MTLAAPFPYFGGKRRAGAGYSARRDNGRRERLWLSPACLDTGEQEALW